MEVNMKTSLQWVVDFFVKFDPNHFEKRNKNGRFLKINLPNCVILKFYPDVKKQIDKILIDNHVRYYEIANDLNHYAIIKVKRDIAILLYKHGNFTLKQIIALSGLSADQLKSVIDIKKLIKTKIVS